MTFHVGPKPHKLLIDCSACGFVHLDSLPDASTVRAYYEDDKFYETHSPPDWFVKEKWEHEQGYWQAYYDYLALFLPHKWVIDIGAGTGRFIYHLSKRGFIVWGFEPSEIARRWSPIKGSMYDDDLLMDEKLKGNIVLMLTLEHVLDPESFLRDEVLPHLDGRLIVTVPNEWNPIQRWVGGWWWVNKVHINYFQPHTLRALLGRVGLTVVHESATAPLELVIALGYDYRGNDERGRKVHNFRLRLERRFPGIYRFLYEPLYKYLHWGRELIFICEKVEK